MLIDLHTFRWLGNGDGVRAIMDNIGAYSYAHTNSNEWDEDDKYDRAYASLVARHGEIMQGDYPRTPAPPLPKESKFYGNTGQDE